MRVGLVLFVSAMLLAVLLVKSGAPLAYRALAFAPFMLASVMVFQSAYRTCIMHALRHRRETERGVERVCSPEGVEADRARARLVLRMSAGVATLATALLFLLP